jgi:hypothetical protein
MLALVLASFSTSPALAKAPAAARVFKITQLAVVLPEEFVRGRKKGTELWTPTSEQVEAAEEAVLHRLKEPQKTPKGLPSIKYIIQYYGVLQKKTKFIACGVYKISALRGHPDYEFNETIELLFTFPYCEFDSDDWRGFYFDPSTGQLFDPMDPKEELLWNKMGKTKGVGTK